MTVVLENGIPQPHIEQGPKVHVGARETNGVHLSGADTKYSSLNDTSIRDVPAWTPPRKLKVITIGAGFSGLIFAHKLQHQHPEFQDLVEHQIYEAREQVGGTWLVNNYPGVQCDVPAHIYV